MIRAGRGLSLPAGQFRRNYVVSQEHRRGVKKRKLRKHDFLSECVAKSCIFSNRWTKKVFGLHDKFQLEADC